LPINTSRTDYRVIKQFRMMRFPNIGAALADLGAWEKRNRQKLVVLVGQKKAVAIAVRNVSGRRRWSKLNEWLRIAKVCWQRWAD
jgi:hypothetical protein